MEEKRVYSSVDLLKFVFSFFIIMIHVDIFSDVSESVNYFFVNIFTRVAVPFFFAVSGFFFAKSFDYNKNKKISKSKTNLKKFFRSEWRIILLYVVWTMIYLFVAMPINYGSWSLHNLFDYALTSVIRCSFYHLWYVYSLVFAYPILYFMMRFLTDKAVSVICISLYSLGIIVNSYVYLIDSPTINGFIEQLNGYAFSYLVTNITSRALPLMWIGIKIASMRRKPKKIICFTFSVMSFALLVAENMLLNKLTAGKVTGHYIIFTVVLVWFLFLFAIQCKNRIGKTTSSVLRKMSTLIYCFHAMIQLVFSNYLLPDINSVFLFLLTSTVSVAISFVILLLSEKRKMKFLRYLY